MSPDDAISMTTLGLVLTPLKGKIPVLKSWTTQPRPSTELVRQWAAMGNLGIRTGRISQVAVIDAEAEAEQDESAKAVVLRLPATWTVNTGGGGRHYYYRLPESVTLGNSVGKLAPYIDVRADGGQVVAPGSVHPGTGAVYEWADGLAPSCLALAELPAWVADALTATPPRARQAKPTGNGDHRGSPYAAAALKGECAAVASAPEGVRNDTLNRAAFKLGTLVGAGELDEADVVASLTASTSLGDHEARLTIRSGIKAGMSKPRPARAAGPDRSGPDRSKRLVADVRAAVSASKPGAFQTWHELGLTLNSNGGPYQNIANAMKVLEIHQAVAGKFWYDVFHYRIFSSWNGPARRFDEHEFIDLTAWFANAVGLHKMSKETVRDAVVATAMRTKRSEPKEWLEKLSWDRVDRLDRLITDGFGAEDTPFMRRIGQCWLTAMVARAFKPGCKLDNVPVFEGAEGKRKSTAMQVIGGQWHSECQESVNSKDFFLSLWGKWLLEIAEMDSFNRNEVTKIKRVVTCPSDYFRAPYDRYADDHRRQSSFACTTNRDDWQRDETGGRRWWPVRCGKIDIDWLVATRDQLFAEAVHRFRAGMDWWEVPIGEAMQAQADRRPEDTWHEIVAFWIDLHRVGFEFLTMHEVLVDAIGLPKDKHDMGAMKRVASVLSDLGYKRAVRRVSTFNTKVWVKK